ncbi:ERF family protein [Sphingomonas sp.]|uniref:ERF family protein n=1 Tax=Sphingomonas sp. TaxID=28214 RepID=UPI0025EB92A3|nr:ERF family protein [Sphingomonas sp.]
MNQRPTSRAPAPPDEAYFEETTDRAPPQERVSHQVPAVATRAAPEQSHKDPAAIPERESAPLPKTGIATIATAIAAVMEEIKPVEKTGWNEFHKYWHARMQDLSTALTPLMGKHGIIVFQNEVSRDLFDGGNFLSVRYEFTIVHKSGEIWFERPIITGVSRCRDRGGFDDKAFNKCHTAARKYFLISLFQIPTEDSEDADNDGGTGNRPRPGSQQRRAPAPDGKIEPHAIPINNGEPPADWATRFENAIAKASMEEADKWYDQNFAQFEKLKKADAMVYNRLVKAMDDRSASATSDPISSGPQKDAPKPQQRAPRQPRTKPDEKPTFDVTEWFQSLENAFSGCEDVDALIAAQEKYMAPVRADVGEKDWNRATDMVRDTIKRFTE